MKTILKKIVPFIFLLLIFLTPASTTKGNSEIFDKFSYKDCSVTIHNQRMRLVRECATGNPLYYELVSEDIEFQTVVQRYCDGGWGWCIGETEQNCPTDEYRIVMFPDRCE